MGVYQPPTLRTNLKTIQISANPAHVFTNGSIRHFVIAPTSRTTKPGPVNTVYGGNSIVAVVMLHIPHST